MGLTYTKAEIRRRVDHILREVDGGGSVLPADAKNRAIADIHRDFVERTGCNRNWSIFSIAADGDDGVLEYDELGGTPTLVKVDVEGFNWYRLSACDRFNEVERFVIEGNTDFTPLTLVDAWGVSSMNLLSSDTQYPHFYQTQGQDLFRMLRKLNATSGYPIKIRIKYRQAVTDLITDDTLPSEALTDDLLVPTVPLKYRKALIWGAAADCLAIDSDGREQTYRALYERAIKECGASVNRDSTDKPPSLHITYKSGGG